MTEFAVLDDLGELRPTDEVAAVRAGATGRARSTDYTWRPVFFTLDGVGPGPNENSHLKLALLQNGNVVSQATLRHGNPDDNRGEDFTQDTMLIDVVRVQNSGMEREFDALNFRFHPPQSIARDEKVFVAWVRVPATLPTTGSPNYDLIGLGELAGGYHADAAHAINQLTPLVENAFAGTTGTDTAEVEIAGVTIEDSANVAYIIRVGTSTEYALGSALYAQRSAGLEVGIANFYSKGGDDAGKLFHTLDEATDDVLEIWKVNDVGALQNVIDQLDTDYVWRPIFYILPDVGSSATDFHTINVAGTLVGRYSTAQNGVVIDLNRVRVDGTEVAASGAAFSFNPPASLADDQKLFAVWANLPNDLPSSDIPDVSITRPAELAGGYHADAAHQINRLTPLIENAFDGTTGTDTGEVEVAGVTIENLGNVAYLIRVGAATEYVLGDALYAQRSGAALQIGIANFYSKGAADAGKLFHTLDEGTDDALEIWKVNDLAAIRSVISAAGKTDAQIGDAAFSNPPADLTDDEKTAAREAINAGPDHIDLPQPVAGLAGLRTESITLQDNGSSTSSSELAPASTDPLALVHPDDDSDLEILSDVTGNDFTVAPGLYLLQAEGELVASQVGRFEIDVRQASDDAIVGGLSPVSFVDTNSAYQGFTASGYWHVTEAVAVNLFLERYGRNVGVRNLVVSFARLTVDNDEIPELKADIDDARYPSNETFTIPEVGTNGVSEHDPLILAARGNVLIGHYFGDSDHFGRSENLNLGIEGIATEDAASGSVKMLAWGLVTGLPMGPQYTHSELQTATNAPPGKPVYVTDRSSRVRPGGSTDNRNTSADLTYWTLDPDESADGEIYGYCVEWEGAAGTNQQGVYGVIFDFRRVRFPSSS